LFVEIIATVASVMRQNLKTTFRPTCSCTSHS